MAVKKVALLASGGPAPGINAVIGAATIEAINQGFQVIGFYDGFKWLCSDDFHPDEHTTDLDISRVARIHFDGGSILRISRTSLIDPSTLNHAATVKPDDALVRRVLDRLRELGVTDLITIGGDDTALSSRFLSAASRGDLRCVHVPKTIDNDLPLPHGVATFGFSTARYGGTQIVKNLMQDSLTTGRWYIVTVMGRTTGWLTLAVGQAASATVTLIPEEFGPELSLGQIADVIDGAMLKRQTMGRPDGVAVVSEGLASRLSRQEDFEHLLGHTIPVDSAGHPRLSEIPLAFLLRKELEQRFADRGDSMNIVSHVLGYELRSANPTPRDMAYCRSLGYGAVRLLLSPDAASARGIMVTLVSGNLVPMAFEDMVDPKTNRIRVRRVDVCSDEYRIARAYMIRLEQADLENPATLQQLAKHAKMSPAEFRKRFHKAATRMVDGVPVECAIDGADNVSG